MTVVVVVDYGSGNLRSAAKALERAARESDSAARIEVSADAEALRRADRVVLPGVGAFADCRRGLEALPGMIDALDEAARKRAVPLLGICIGMQLFATLGREHGETPGFDWIAGEVVRLEPADGALKVPHMGWNEIRAEQAGHPMLAGLPEGAFFYFVHSYQFRPSDTRDLAASVDYGGPVTAAVARGNLFGTQFHPEKSQANGLRLLANFLGWRP
jgi:glutamine amidotransferase